MSDDSKGSRQSDIHEMSWIILFFINDPSLISKFDIGFMEMFSSSSETEYKDSVVKTSDLSHFLKAEGC